MMPENKATSIAFLLLPTLVPELLLIVRHRLASILFGATVKLLLSLGLQIESQSRTNH